MAITVPMQAPGAKSLPAQMRIGQGSNGMMRLRAQHPGYPGGYTGIAPQYVRGMSGLRGLSAWRGGMRGLGMRGLGDDEDGSEFDDTPTPLPAGGDLSLLPGLDLNPITAAGGVDFYTPVTVPTSVTSGSAADITAVFGSGSSASDPNQIAALNQIAAMNPPSSLYNGPTVYPSGSTPPAAPAGYQWANLVNQSGQSLAKVLAISQGGSTVTLPNGTQIVYGSPASAAAGAAGSLLGTGTVAGIPIGTVMVIGAGVLLLMMVSGGGGRR